MSPVIIAEACQNHKGDREILKRMVHEAAANGADYVKIQSIRSREVTYRERFEQGLLGPEGETKVIRRPYADEVRRMKDLELTLDDEAWFVDECLRAGVRSMTTVFSRATAKEVRELGFDAVKIASYDCSSYPLLRQVRRDWARVVVSTGATQDAEIAQSAAILNSGAFVFLHCVTVYPTPLSELHLRRLAWLRRYCPEVGFSDHSATARDGISASLIALALGADYIERHFTVLPASETKDGPVSISPGQLGELRRFANRPRPERMEIVRRELSGWERTLGQMRRPLSPEELLNRDYYRGRFASKVGQQTVFNWEDQLLD